VTIRPGGPAVLLLPIVDEEGLWKEKHGGGGIVEKGIRIQYSRSEEVSNGKALKKKKGGYGAFGGQ